jgi:hypothetical protein
MAFGDGQPQPTKRKRAALVIACMVKRTKASRRRQQNEAKVDKLLQPPRDDVSDDNDSEQEEDKDRNDSDGNDSDRLNDSEGNDGTGNGRLTIKERESLGLDLVSYEQIQVTVMVAYIREFKSLPECDWRAIVTTLKGRLGVSRKSIRQVFLKCPDGVSNPEKQMKGAGCKHWLARDNKGLITGAAALNGLGSPACEN